MRSKALILLTTLVGAAVGAAPAYSQLTLFIEPREVKPAQADELWVEADLSGELKASIGKFVPGVQLVANAEAASMVMRHSATVRSRGESTAKRMFVGRGASARGTAELVDSCGRIVWTNSAKDTSRLLAAAVGDFAKPGPAKVADRIANRLNDAVRNGKIRPCAP